MKTLRLFALTGLGSSFLVGCCSLTEPHAPGSVAISGRTHNELGGKGAIFCAYQDATDVSHPTCWQIGHGKKRVVGTAAAVLPTPGNYTVTFYPKAPAQLEPSKLLVPVHANELVEVEVRYCNSAKK